MKFKGNKLVLTIVAILGYIAGMYVYDFLSILFEKFFG